MIAMRIVKRGGEEDCFDTANVARHDRNSTGGSVPKPLETEDLF